MVNGIIGFVPQKRRTAVVTLLYGQFLRDKERGKRESGKEG
jgi:hypothetical protein